MNIFKINGRTSRNRALNLLNTFFLFEKNYNDNSKKKVCECGKLTISYYRLNLLWLPSDYTWTLVNILRQSRKIYLINLSIFNPLLTFYANRAKKLKNISFLKCLIYRHFNFTWKHLQSPFIKLFKSGG